MNFFKNRWYPCNLRSYCNLGHDGYDGIKQGIKLKKIINRYTSCIRNSNPFAWYMLVSEEPLGQAVR